MSMYIFLYRYNRQSDRVTCPEPHRLCISSCLYPGGSDGKEFACNAGDLGLIPESERSTREGNGNPYQDSCLENSTGRGAWQVIVHGVANSLTRLSN